MQDCRCNERRKGKPKGSTCLGYTGLIGGLEHLKIETKLIDERFPSVMGEEVHILHKNFVYDEREVKTRPIYTIHECR